MNRKQKIVFLFIGRTVESAVTAGMFFSLLMATDRALRS